ncbi:Z561 [Enterospora canceri]|uniref:Z561 n=1 Tax=Enterospora canceri TaxID=1081671 RepID=A0A1Y1S8V0_9MICR|nr:Z561 [Enterospora canceri]
MKEENNENVPESDSSTKSRPKRLFGEVEPELAREKFRQLALKERGSNTSNKEYEFPPVQKVEAVGALSSPQKRRKSTSSSSRPSDVIKVEPPKNSENVKSFNDFDEKIFEMDETRGMFVCPVSGCEKEFPSLSRIKRHYIIHTDIKPFKCKNKDCDRRFSRKDNMLQHYRTHCPYTK